MLFLPITLYLPLLYIPSIYKFTLDPFSLPLITVIHTNTPLSLSLSKYVEILCYLLQQTLVR